MNNTEIKTSTKTEKPIRTFTPEEEKKFRKMLDQVCYFAIPEGFELVLKQYKIYDHPEGQQFMEMISKFFNSWRKPEWNTEVSNMQSHPSRCMGCEYGRNVTAYTFEYYHPDAPVPKNMIHRKWSFGILCRIENGALLDLGVCNSFLTREEMNELNAQK